MTAQLISFPGHHWHGCSDYRCTICEGALSLCTVCGGAEGALPTDCPGQPMQEQLLDEVYAGQLDFRRETGWTQQRSETWNFLGSTRGIQ